MTTHAIHSLVVFTGLALVGCADVTDSADGELVVEGAEGKADGLNGKRMGFRVSSSLIGGFEDLGGWDDTTRIVAASADRVVISSDAIHLSPYGDDSVGTTDWRGTGILRLTAESRSTDTDVGFVLLNPDRDVFSDAPITVLGCRSSQASVNFFRTLDIDGDRKTITVNGTKTFTFAQCGFSMKTAAEYAAEIHSAYETARVQAFVLPTRWPGSGATGEKSFAYHLGVELL